MIGIICFFQEKSLPNSSMDAEIARNFCQQRNTSCQYPDVTEMLKFALYSTCNLHLNIIKGFFITPLEDNLVQVRNWSLGKDWEWFLSSSLLLISLILPHHWLWWWGQDKCVAIMLCFLTWVVTETMSLSIKGTSMCTGATCTWSAW